MPSTRVLALLLLLSTHTFATSPPPVDFTALPPCARDPSTLSPNIACTAPVTQECICDLTGPMLWMGSCPLSHLPAVTAWYRATCPLPGVIPPLTAESANWESKGAHTGAWVVGVGVLVVVVAGVGAGL